MHWTMLVGWPPRLIPRVHPAYGLRVAVAGVWPTKLSLSSLLPWGRESSVLCTYAPPYFALIRWPCSGPTNSGIGIEGELRPADSVNLWNQHNRGSGSDGSAWKR